MASRHPIPSLLRSDIGGDDRKIVPRFAEPLVVEFAAGKALGEFVEVIKANKSVRIIAAAGAGKSVRMPTEVFRALGGVFVHCIPSMLLAVSLHDYIASLKQPDVPVSLCTEVTDDFPKSGLVFTSSATFLGQCCRWKSQGVNPGVMLYMDECHESDSGTATIRALRHALPGVAKYAESSATHGTGDMSSAFIAARLPSAVSEVRVPMPPPAEWNMNDSAVPWSLKKLTGDIIVFTDDDEEAKVVMGKFEMSGLRAFRLTGHSKPDEFRRVMSSLDASGQDAVSVLVLDYTFRSGFSFPTVDRIIDLSKVKVYELMGGRTQARYRDPHSAEVYQTKNRGGRIKGRDCVYFRRQFEPQNILVHLEGAEALISALWFRMLGYAPISLLDGTRTYSGKVPSNILVAWMGRHMLTSYSFDTEWPGRNPAAVEEVVQKPLVLMPPVSPVSEVSAVGNDVDTLGGYVGGRPPSVFSLQGDENEEELKSDEGYLKAHRKSLRAANVGKDGDLPPLPTMDKTFVALKGMSDLRSSVRTERFKLEMGEYYRLRGFDGNLMTCVFPDGIHGVVNAAGEHALKRFVQSLMPEAATEARQRSSVDLTRATVKYRALATVMAAVDKQREKFQVLDQQALAQWFEMCRDFLIASDTVIRQCFSVSETAGSGEMIKVDAGEFASDERAFVDSILTVLRSCVESFALPNRVLAELEGTDSSYMDEIVQHSEGYKHLNGRINMRINGKSIRERIANFVLGGRPVEVDAIASL